MLARCKNLNAQSPGIARKFVKKVSSPQHAYSTNLNFRTTKKNRLISSSQLRTDISPPFPSIPLYPTSSTRRVYTTSFEASSSGGDATSTGVPFDLRNDDDAISLFDSTHSAWEKVFQGLDDLPPLQPDATRHSFRPSVTPLDNKTRSTRRQSMTAREISAFDDMFNMIFNAVSESKDKLADPGFRQADPLTSAGIGRGPEGTSNMNDLYGKLRRHSKKFKWTVEEDEELVKKKIEIEKCETDYQLLEWTMKEVFEDSRKREEIARKAILEASEGKSVDTLPMLQSPSYSHLVAHLIMTFRERFHDPHLALSIFEYARRLSIASYVFGCTTPAFNELIETRWKCFRDLKGVSDALEEMKINGVEPDGRTKIIVEAVRRELGDRNFWLEESELDTEEVAQILNKMEVLVAKELPDDFDSQLAKKNSKRWNWTSERWKLSGAMEEKDDDDEWEFGSWDAHTLEKQAERQAEKLMQKPHNLRKDTQKIRMPNTSKMLFHNY